MFALAKTRNENLIDTEQSYLLAIREGDDKAYEYVFKTYYEDLARYAFSILKKSEESEDLVQQVFVNFWEKREQTIISGSLKSYLFRSVHNQCLNKIKHDKVKANYVVHSQYYDTKYHSEVEEELEGWIQVINATPAELFNFSAKTSLGVLNPNLFLGRLFKI
jgi:RNA polymerase sigma-70 factor, ECF subfamily